jgi:pyridoxine 5'-phosphate synthase PdxJ
MTISVLIIAQDHQDHFPLLTVEKIAKCSKDSGLKVSIGYELVPDDIKKLVIKKKLSIYEMNI